MMTNESGPLERERQDPANDKGGVFYDAPRDPRVWVPKRWGLGWTLNFAHRASWWWVLAIVGLASLAALMAVMGAG